MDNTDIENWAKKENVALLRVKLQPCVDGLGRPVSFPMNGAPKWVYLFNSRNPSVEPEFGGEARADEPPPLGCCWMFIRDGLIVVDWNLDPNTGRELEEEEFDSIEELSEVWDTGRVPPRMGP